MRPVSDTEVRIAWSPDPSVDEYQVLELGGGRSSGWFEPDRQLPIDYYDFTGLTKSSSYGFTVMARKGSGTTYAPFVLGSTMAETPTGHGMVGNRHGLDGARYLVTTSADNGPGSLRDALNRSEPLYVQFAVSDIFLTGDQLRVTSTHKTIDGTSAPRGYVHIHPGTNENGMSFEDVEDGGPGAAAAYIFVRGLYVDDSDRDGFAIGGRDIRLDDALTFNDYADPSRASHHIVLFECSAFDSKDGNIDVGSGAHDWTVQRCAMGNILYRPRDNPTWANQKNMLIGSGPSDIIRRGSMIRNLILRSDSRAPLVQGEVTDVVVANNVLFAAMGYGWRVQCHCATPSSTLPCAAGEPCYPPKTAPSIMNNYVVPMPLRYRSSSGEMVTQSALKKKVHTVNWPDRDRTQQSAHMSGNRAHNGALEPLHTHGEPSSVPGYTLWPASEAVAYDVALGAGAAFRTAAEAAKRDSLVQAVVRRPFPESEAPRAVPGSIFFADVGESHVVMSVSAATDVDRGRGATPTEDMEYSAVWYPVGRPAEVDSAGFFADTRLEIHGFEPNTRYSIAVRAWDQWHNPAPLGESSRFRTRSDGDNLEQPRATADDDADPLSPTPAAEHVTVRPSPGRGPFRVEWSVSDPSPASLHVVDAGGRQLWTALASGLEGTRTWSGRDSGGRHVASGVYWLVVRQRGRAVAVNRFVVMGA